MSAARKTLALLNNFETILCEILLALFVVLLFAQIMFRQLFGYNIAWSEELSTYMFVWFAYLGAVVAAKMSAHNRVTVHFRYMPKWMSSWCCRPRRSRRQISGSRRIGCSPSRPCGPGWARSRSC